MFVRCPNPKWGTHPCIDGSQRFQRRIMADKAMFMSYQKLCSTFYFSRALR